MSAWKRIPNYIKTFGICEGARIFFAVDLRPRKKGVLFSVRVAGNHIALRNTIGDKAILFQIMVKQEYELGTWPKLQDRLKRAYNCILASGRVPIIIDAGANIGLASLWFAANFPECQIYAVEPDPANVDILRKNVSDRSNIVVLAGAVWDKRTNLRIQNPEAGAASYRVGEGAGEGAKLRAYTIREIGELSSGKLFIVKIDIEGGEDRLFASDTGWLSEVNLTVLELHDWLYPGEGTSRNFLRAISGQYVDFVFQGENVFCFRKDEDCDCDAVAERSMPQ